MWPALVVSQHTPTRFARIFGVCHTFATIPYSGSGSPSFTNRIGTFTQPSAVFT